MKKSIRKLIKENIGYSPVNYAIVIIIVSTIANSLIYVYYNNTVAASSIISTPIITFAFVMLWDGYNSKKIKKALLKVFLDEIHINIACLVMNKEILQSELEIMETERIELRPLLDLSIEKWELLKNQYPEKLMKLDSSIQIQYYQGIKHINKAISLREYFQINENLIQRANFDRYMIGLIQRTRDAIGDLLDSKEMEIIFETENFKEELIESYYKEDDIDDNLENFRFKEFLMKFFDSNL